MKKSDTYLKLVEWNDEEQCYIGSAPPLIGPCCHGDDQTKVFAQLCTIVDDWIALLEKDGLPFPEPIIPPDKEFSGKLLLRIDPGLHKKLAIRSLQEGKSLNAYIREKLSV